MLKKYLLIGLTIIGIGIASSFFITSHKNGICAYSSARDREFIRSLFKEDWYWLVSDYSPDYSVERMLDYKAATEDPSSIGKLIIKTYCVQGKPAGFVAYYTQELFEGKILFLAIGKEYRAKGYARALLSYAIDDLKSKGVTVIRLITRTDNTRGRKLYTGMGFKQVWTDGAYIKYEKQL